MQSIIIENAVITSTTIVGSKKPYTLSGCVYDAYRKKVVLSERYKGNPGEVYVTKNPNKLDKKHIEATHNLKGNCIYLGHMMSHYGHFMTETISTFWALISKHSYDHYIFQSFEGSKQTPEFAKPILKAFNIPDKKIIIIQENTQVDNLTIPERLHEYNHNIKPEAFSIYEHIRRYVLSNQEPKTTPTHLYLSRKKNSQKKANRSIINEPFLERILTNFGFTIIYLEELRFEEQVTLVHNAKVIIGFSGSALHNCVFMQKKAHLIEFDDSRSSKKFLKTQYLLNELSQIQSDRIPFKGFLLSKSLDLSFVNLNHLQKQLMERLQIQQPIYSGVNFKSLTEVAYISLKSVFAMLKNIVVK